MTSPSLFYREIPLTHGRVALVDIEDYEWLTKWHWHARHDKSSGSWYALRNYRIGPGGKIQRCLSMHRAIMGIGYGDPRTVDHVRTGETLDNRRHNLRIATHSQQAMNRRVLCVGPSGYRGVRYHAKGKNWEARVTLERKTISLGVYATPEKAYAAYCAAARSMHGEFAKLT